MPARHHRSCGQGVVTNGADHLRLLLLLLWLLLWLLLLLTQRLRPPLQQLLQPPLLLHSLEHIHTELMLLRLLPPLLLVLKAPDAEPRRLAASQLKTTTDGRNNGIGLRLVARLRLPVAAALVPALPPPAVASAAGSRTATMRTGPHSNKCKQQSAATKDRTIRESRYR